MFYPLPIILTFLWFALTCRNATCQGCIPASVCSGLLPVVCLLLFLLSYTVGGGGGGGGLGHLSFCANLSNSPTGLSGPEPQVRSLMSQEG